MIGYFLVLTFFLPSNIVSEPYSLTEGTYVSYLLEDLGFYNEVIRNGTYTWKILSMYTDSSGRRMAQINESFTGDSELGGYKYSIPPNGRITEIDLSQGVLNGLRIWFGNYYNEYLLDRTVFQSGDGYPLEGVGHMEISFQGERRICTAVTVQIPAPYRTSTYFYDRATGILLLYRYGFREIQMRARSFNKH